MILLLDVATNSTWYVFSSLISNTIKFAILNDPSGRLPGPKPRSSEESFPALGLIQSWDFLYYTNFFCIIDEAVFLDVKYATSRASLVAQLVKNLPTMQENLVQFLGWEDPLEIG